MILTGLRKSEASGVRPHRLSNTASGKDSFSPLHQGLTQMGNCGLPSRAAMIEGGGAGMGSSSPIKAVILFLGKILFLPVLTV